jgi:hypothetical protein
MAATIREPLAVGAVLSGWSVRIDWHGAIAPQRELAGPAQ